MYENWEIWWLQTSKRGEPREDERGLAKKEENYSWNKKYEYK